MAPGMFIKEIWDSKEYKSLFYEAFNNLHEDFKEEDKMLEKPNNLLSQYYRDLDYKREEHYHLKWDISEKDIVDELDR